MGPITMTIGADNIAFSGLFFHRLNTGPSPHRNLEFLFFSWAMIELHNPMRITTTAIHAWTTFQTDDEFLPLRNVLLVVRLYSCLVAFLVLEIPLAAIVFLAFPATRRALHALALPSKVAAFLLFLTTRTFHTEIIRGTKFYIKKKLES